jgi:hypothetical protein
MQDLQKRVQLGDFDDTSLACWPVTLDMVENSRADALGRLALLSRIPAPSLA